MFFYHFYHVSLSFSDTNGFFIKHVQSGLCYYEFLRFYFKRSWSCFDARANLKFLQSGSIMEVYSKRCLVRQGNEFRFKLPNGNFNGSCGAINAITQTFWGGLLFSHYNKCIGGHPLLKYVSCKNEENQRFNFGK